MLASSALVDVSSTRRGASSPTRRRPVMIAKSGRRLLADEALRAVASGCPAGAGRDPNHPEAEELVGTNRGDRPCAAATRIVEMGGAGDHEGRPPAGAEVVDLLHDGREFWEFRSPRIETTSTTDG